MKRDLTHTWWTIEWATWILAISSGLYAWFAGIPGLGGMLLALQALAVWVFYGAFTLACLRLADRYASPRHLIGRIFHGRKAKRD